MQRLVCSACGTKHTKKAKFCWNCGHHFAVADGHESVSKIISHEFIHSTFHANLDIFRTFWKLFRDPGNTLVALVHAEDKYKKSIYYFLASLSLYTLITEIIFRRFHFKFLMSGEIDPHVAPFLMMALLIVIAIIGYITLGWKYKFHKNDDYTFSEVFVICLYIYGTDFLLAPIIILVAQPFRNALEIFGEAAGGKLTDVPLALYMACMLLRLVQKTKSYKYRYPRYILFLILAYTYYYFTWDGVDRAKVEIHHFFSE